MTTTYKTCTPPGGPSASPGILRGSRGTPVCRQAAAGATALLLASAVTAEPASPSEGLQEIVVTASRRAESVQQIPISVTALDQALLSTMGVRDIADVTRLAPGVDLAAGVSTAQPIISVRGISSTVGTATTGLYIDDTPIQVRMLGAGLASASAMPAIFDLDRIEVLRGPQGTLFGSGSEGGTVRFITPEPSLSQWSGHARAEYSFLENGQPSTQFGLAGGGPIISNQLGFRVSAYSQTEAGWINLVPFGVDTAPVRNANSSLTQAITAALAWRPVDSLTITPSIFYQRYHQDHSGGYWSNLSDPGNGSFVAGWLQAWPATDRFVLPSLKLEWQGPGVALFSNTSYLDHARDTTIDGSFYNNEILTGSIAGPVAPTPFVFANPQRQFTQEIRLQSSDPSQRIRYVVGGFYQSVSQRSDETAISPELETITQAFFGLSVEELFGSGLVPGGIAYVSHDTSRDTQLAGFAQLDLDLIDGLTLTLGERVSRMRYEFTNAQDGPFNGGPSGTSGAHSETNSAPKVGLTYKPSSHAMVYASVGKGFRPGGGNVFLPAARCTADLGSLGLTQGPSTYNSDQLWSYEIGTKGDALHRAVEWDASAFYVKWNNIQSLVLLPDCGFSFVGNLGSAVSKGFDLQVNAELTSRLTVGASLAYTDARYAATVASATPAPLVSDGDRLPAAPWHGTASIDYIAFTLANDGKGYLHLDGQYGSPYTTGNPADALYDPVQSKYYSSTFANLRAGVRRNGWDVSLFVRNLTNSHSVLWTIHDVRTSELRYNGTFGPRSIGVTANYQF